MAAEPGQKRSTEDVVYRHVDEERGRALGQLRISPREACEICGRVFNEIGYLVDGRIEGALVWADMCPDCVALHGAGVGWGHGQLYKLQSDGSWLLVGGFAPERAEEIGN